jgi:uncharacterized protein (TIGR02246 family)
MARSPQEAFETHLESLAAGDLEKIAADYTEDCIQITNCEVRRGKAGVKEAFASIFQDLAAHGEIKGGVEVPVRVFEGDILYIEWWADMGDMRCDGVDTFVFDDGQISVQTVKYSISKAN